MDGLPEMMTRWNPLLSPQDTTVTAQCVSKRIHDLVDELHNKVANRGCSNYDTVLLPDFKTWPTSTTQALDSGSVGHRARQSRV